jgi:serpin B
MHSASELGGGNVSDRAHRRWVVLVTVSVLVAACSDSTISTTVASPSAPSTTDTAPATSIVPVRDLLGCPGRGFDSPEAELAAGLNTAGFDLWRDQLVEGNLVFSPASIGHTLLMARGAADEATGAAIDRALCLPAGIAAHEAWRAIADSIALADYEEKVVVAIADRIWPRLDITPDPAWVDLLADEHGMTLQPLDLAGEPEASREVINAWVADQTKGLIPELLPDGFINAEMVLVLTDALYFEAEWQRQFGKYSPVTDTFARLDGSTVQVEFLRELELADRRGRGDGFVGAELPYAGGAFSMLLIVPDEGRFAEVRDRLDQDLLDQIDATFTTGPYELLMPRWDATTNLDLMGWLSSIGAAPGHYPGISPDAFLGAAVHGADIAVDELGTVAAAATAAGFLTSGPPTPQLTVRADKPFLYLIRQRSTGLVLFAGQVTDPTP